MIVAKKSATNDFSNVNIVMKNTDCFFENLSVTKAISDKLSQVRLPTGAHWDISLIFRIVADVLTRAKKIINSEASTQS